LEFTRIPFSAHPLILNALASNIRRVAASTIGDFPWAVFFVNSASFVVTRRGNNKSRGREIHLGLEK
jgi:hypothetical protein